MKDVEEVRSRMIMFSPLVVTIQFKTSRIELLSFVMLCIAHCNLFVVVLSDVDADSR